MPGRLTPCCTFSPRSLESVRLPWDLSPLKLRLSLARSAMRRAGLFIPTVGSKSNYVIPTTKPPASSRFLRALSEQQKSMAGPWFSEAESKESANRFLRSGRDGFVRLVPSVICRTDRHSPGRPSRTSSSRRSSRSISNIPRPTRTTSQRSRNRKKILEAE